MPKAITFLGNIVNFSVFYNTITVYPKITKLAMQQISKTKVIPFTERPIDSLLLEAEYNESLFRSFLENYDKELGYPQYMRSRNRFHDLYHQDEFNTDDDHWHMQFDKTIDKTMLESKLKVFEKQSLISPHECSSFIKAFLEANALPVIINIKEGTQTTLSGFKKGFMFSTSAGKRCDIQNEQEQNNAMKL